MGADLGDMLLMLLGGATSIPALYGIVENIGHRISRNDR